MTDPLIRIAAALERLSPPALPDSDLAQGTAFRWTGERIAAVTPAMPLPLDRFVGVDSQMESLRRNIAALARMAPAHDMLLWGVRGMGKSALLRSVSLSQGVPLVETGGDLLGTLPALFERLATVQRPFLVYVDDLAFATTDQGVRQLRSLLDGGVSARPANVRLAVTSNHRNLIDRPPTDSREVRHARDVADDQLALVDRFGLVLGFHLPDQDQYLEMVERHLAAAGLRMDKADALAFAAARGSRSGRTAWHYLTDVLARAATS